MESVPAEVMIDANIQSHVKEDQTLRDALAEAPIRVWTCVTQENEIWDGIERPVDRDDETRKYAIQTMDFDEEVDPNRGGVDTVGYGEPYGYVYGGGTGNIYEEMIQSDDNIGDIERADAQGVEAAINREIPFVTEESAIKDRMREYGYEDYLISWEEFRCYLEAME